MKKIQYNGSSRKIHRIVFLLLFFYAVYMGYKSWQLLHSSFVTPDDIQYNSNRPSVPYRNITEWQQSRLQTEFPPASSVKNNAFGP